MDLVQFGWGSKKASWNKCSIATYVHAQVCMLEAEMFFIVISSAYTARYWARYINIAEIFRVD